MAAVGEGLQQQLLHLWYLHKQLLCRPSCSAALSTPELGMRQFRCGGTIMQCGCIRNECSAVLSSCRCTHMLPLAVAMLPPAVRFPTAQISGWQHQLLKSQQQVQHMRAT